MDQAIPPHELRASTRPPDGCSDPGRWMDAYLIAEAHRAERGVCTCGRPLPCVAAERAASIMAETMRAAQEAEAAAAAQRAFREAVTQELPIIRVETPVAAPAPVGARFNRRRGNDEDPQPIAIPTGIYARPEFDEPEPAPVGARFYRERRPRHRA